MLLKAAGCIVSYWFEQMNYTYKKIWLIAFPVMMSILIEQLINITDALFLGHVGDVELGASALAGIWFLAIYMLGFGFSLGLQVIIARRNGEQWYAETGGERALTGVHRLQYPHHHHAGRKHDTHCTDKEKYPARGVRPRTACPDSHHLHPREHEHRCPWP